MRYVRHLAVLWVAGQQAGSVQSCELDFIRDHGFPNGRYYGLKS